MFGRSKLATKRCALLELQLADDLLARALVGRGRERDARHVRKALGEHLELAILGAEVVSPLRDAVRLVDGEQRQLGAGQQRQRAILQQPLGRDVEDVETTGGDAVLERRLLAIVERRVEKGGLDAGLRQRLDLILHERDQRRDDDAGAGAHERGDLVAQRLAAAGRHQRQRVATGDHRRDDVRLVRAEVAKAEYVGQNLPRTIEGAGGIHDLARCGARHFPRDTMLPNPASG